MTTLLTYKFTVTKEELMGVMRNKNRVAELEDTKDARIAELEALVKELERRDGDATHMIMDADFKKHEMSLRISDLERQLAEATTWRSPETAPRDGTPFIGYYDTDKILGTRADLMCDEDDQYLWLTNEGFMVKRKTLVGWLPLPELKKEDV